MFTINLKKKNTIMIKFFNRLMLSRIHFIKFINFQIRTHVLFKKIQPLQTCQNHNYFIIKTSIHNTTQKSKNDENFSSEMHIEEEETSPLILDEHEHRQLVYPNSDDKIIQQLSNCASVQAVFDILEENFTKLNEQHAVQAILVLRDLQRNYYNINITVPDLDSNIQDPYLTMQNYMEKVSAHPTFLKTLQILEQNYDALSLDALSCVLLYLSKMNFHNSHKTMQKLIIKFGTDIKQYPKENLPLTEVSRYLVTIYREKGLYPVLLSSSLYPKILYSLENCTEEVDFRLITICLNRMHQLVGQSILNQYKEKAEFLLDQKTITSQNGNTVLKIVQFLNYPHWSQFNGSTIRKFLTLLKGNLNQFDFRELHLLHKVLTTHLEPRDILTEVQEISSKLLSNPELYSPIYIESNILSCVVPFSPPTKRQVYENYVRKNINDNYFIPSTIPALFKILRYVKTSDFKLCHLFWSKTLRYLQETPSERFDYQLFRMCYKYMHFNNNMAGTYRHYEFEMQMFDWLLDEINNGMSGIVPAKFSRAIQFLMAYGFSNIKNPKIAQKLIDLKPKLITMGKQFNIFDCFNLSRGLQIAIELNCKRSRSKIFDEYFQIVNEILNQQNEKYLNEDLNLMEVNYLLKSFVIRHESINNTLFHKISNKFIEVQKNSVATSRYLKDFVFISQTTNVLIPEIIEQYSHYIIEQQNFLLGDTVEKFLYLIYHLGYHPQYFDELMKAICRIIYDDKFRMTSLSLLQSALALAFFQQLPQFLIQYIFTEEFLEQVDHEIKNCYSKALYPLRVRSNLMQLNRAVCLDYPEMKVPWFHQKYCETLEDKYNSKDDNSKILSILSEAVGGKEYIKSNVFTPYTYNIHYELHMDRSRQLVPADSTNVSKDSLTKIACIILNSNCFTLMNKSIKGPIQMKQRHLEILGYRVLYLNPNEWLTKSTYEKIKIVQNQIWNSDNIAASDNVL